MAKSIVDYVCNAVRKSGNLVRRSIEKKMHRLDERYDFCITDSRKGLYTLGDYAKGFMRVAAPVTGAVVLALNAAGCKAAGGGYDSVVNTPPKITSTPTTQVQEGKIYNYQLNATDAEGDNVFYNLPVAPGWLTINATTGVVSGTAPQVDADMPCDIVASASDGKSTENQNYTLTVKNSTGNDYLDVEGYLQDNETDSPKKGLVNIYDSADTVNPIGTTTANPVTGRFSYSSTTKKVSDLSGVVIKAATTDASENLTSYIRKKSFPAGDVNAGIVRVVPYPTFCSNDIFKQHMNDVNFNFRKCGIKKVEILKYDPLNPSLTFSDAEQEFIRGKINDPSDILVYTEGRNLEVQVDTSENQDSQKHYIVAGGVVIPDEEYAIVFREISAGGQTTPYDGNGDGIVERARIKLGVVNNTGVSHEFGHALYASGGEAHTLGPEYTIMWTSGNTLTKPGIGDAKSAKIVNEVTYLPKEKLDDLLELGWQN